MEIIARSAGVLFIPVVVGLLATLFVKKERKVIIGCVVAILLFGLSMYGRAKASIEFPASEGHKAAAKMRASLPIQLNELEYITAVNYFSASKTFAFRVTANTPVNASTFHVEKMAIQAKSNWCNDPVIKTIINNFGVTYSMDYFDINGSKYATINLKHCA